jgi:hypothetical protein
MARRPALRDELLCPLTHVSATTARTALDHVNSASHAGLCSTRNEG